MSYKFGQFRRTQLGSYSTTLPFEIYSYENELTDENIKFKQQCLKLTETEFKTGICYYINFSIRQRPDSIQTFYLKLKNTTLTEDNQQIIKEFSVPAGNGIVTLESTFSPNANYDILVWELKRIRIDYQLLDSLGISGRVISLVVNSLTKLINIVPLLKENYDNLEYLAKIGVQGPPSLLMCINGEEIRIGKNRIYEIDNSNIKISSLCFVLTSRTEFFIVDFEYFTNTKEEEENNNSSNIINEEPAQDPTTPNENNDNSNNSISWPIDYETLINKPRVNNSTLIGSMKFSTAPDINENEEILILNEGGFIE